MPKIGDFHPLLPWPIGMADQDPRPSRSRRPKLARAGYLLFLLAFTFLCVELGARWYLVHALGKSTTKKFRFNSYRVYEHVPGFREGDGEREWIAINGQGFRHKNEVAIDKPDDTYRIFLMGGSAAHGISSNAPYPVVHIGMDETIDAQLASLLQQAHPDDHIEVVNAAVTGYNVFQHTAYLLSELLEYDPDLVIFFDGANDHYTSDPAFRYLPDFKYQFWSPRLKQPSLAGQFDYTAHYLAEYSAFFRAYISWKMNRDAFQNNLRMSMDAGHASAADRIAAHRAAAPKQFLRSVEMNLFLLHREGIDAVLCLQPMLALRDPANRSKEEHSFPKLREDTNVRVLYPVILEELEEAAQRWNVPLIDMNVPFNHAGWKGKQLLIDYCHLTPLGGRVAAEALLPVVDPLRIMRSKRPIGGTPSHVPVRDGGLLLDSSMIKAPPRSGT